MAKKATARIRMYRLSELGDCFLVTLTVGDKVANMLIDCGSFRNTAASKAHLALIAGQIKTDLNGAKLDVVVGTHQHNDHLSGFLHHTNAFKTIGVDHVWLSWLDDPQDKTARKIGKDHNNLLAHLTLAAKKMRGVRGANAQKGEVLRDMLGFFGATDSAPPDVPAKAVAILKTLGDEKPRYLQPGEVFDMPALPASSVRVHVLGPPRDHASLYRKDPKTGESYDDALATASSMAGTFARALDRESPAVLAEEREYPFNADHKRASTRGSSPALLAMQRRYHSRTDKWRTIDDDWMQQAENLALYLNDYTNNSSLVLALELVDSGKILLFAADAQTGNWASWKDIKWPSGHPGTRNLLERTVFYKVGHHASHNATLVDAFEEMGGTDLVALIPVNKTDPNITKKNGWKMPAAKLFKRLVERTEGRVLQMDGVNPPETTLTNPQVKEAWKRAGVKVAQTKLAITLDIQ